MDYKKGTVIVIALISFLLFVPLALANTTNNSTYGSGTYGGCGYGSCSLTLSSNGSVNLNVVPGSNPTYSVHSDTVSVTTDSSAGYTLTINNNSTNTAMINGSNSIPASSATAASPATLSADTWGYRLDGLSDFGAGPTSAQDSVTSLGLTFAGVPASNAPYATLATSSSPADPTVNTTVWYGICADVSIPIGTYSTGVVYTAVTN